MPRMESHSSQVKINYMELRDGSLSVQRFASNSKELSRRRSMGVLIGADLLNWVANPQTDAQRRIDSILRLIVQLRDLNRANDKTREIAVLWQGKRFSTSRHIYSKRTDAAERELSARLNRCLQRYKFEPMYYHQLDDRPVLGWFSGLEKSPASDERASEAEFSEGDAIICIMELAREDLFKDLQTCDCGKWFFARFIHQKFCSQWCQQKHHRSSPEYKEGRRAYMKNLRAMHKRTYFPTPSAKGKTTAKAPSANSSSSKRRK